MATYRRAILATAALLSLLSIPGHSAVDKRLKWDKKKWGPMVPHTKFPRDCSLCHVAKRWDVIKSDFHFDHLKETGYALEGAHATAACLRCHNDRGPIKAYVARGCGGCHVDQHRGTLGVNCAQCHNQVGWKTAGGMGKKIADHAKTRFPLTGMHASIDCRQCHTQADAGIFQGTPLDCYSCHQTDFARAKATPASNHLVNGFPQTCQNCHTTIVFGPGTAMQHQYVANVACVTCHQGDYQATTNPNHAASGFPTTCLNCHNTVSWTSASGVDHTKLGPNPNCYSCHSTDYANARATPASNHAANGFPLTCQNCHPANQPLPNPFGPGTQMQHQYVASMACYTCHSADFNAAAVTPASHHQANGFPTTSPACQTCHSLAAASFTSWSGVVMTGSAADHSVVGGAGAACQNCHMGEYNSTNNPPHAATGYAANQCSTCHGTTTNWSDWTGASGAHPSALCSSNHGGGTCTNCHVGGNFNFSACSCSKCHGPGTNNGPQVCGSQPTNTNCPPNT